MSWLLYKTNRFHFAVGLYSDNAQRTSKRGENISHCSHHVLTSSVRYQNTDARQNGIYLLNITKKYLVGDSKYNAYISVIIIVKSNSDYI